MLTPNEQTGGNSQDFARFVELQQKHSQANNQLEALEVTINKAAQAATKTSAEAYVVLQESVAQLDAQLKVLFEDHPEWRGEKKSVNTPFGTVDQRKVTELEVPNPALTVALIEARQLHDPKFIAEHYLHISKEPDLETLEGFEDAELAKLGINRITTERITVKPAKVSVAKAVKAAKTQTK